MRLLYTMYQSDTSFFIILGKSTHFFGLPEYDQLIKSLDREKIVEMSRSAGGKRYVKSFGG